MAIQWAKIRWEEISCPICRCTRRNLFWKGRASRYGAGPVFSVVECTGCGHLYETPRPVLEDFVDYILGEDRLYHPPEGLIKRMLAFFSRHFDARIITAALTRGARVLEVGCGDGQLLQRLSDQHVRAEGVEPDAGLARIAQKTGRCIHPTAFEGFRPGFPYDAAVLRYVIANLYHPMEAFRRLSNMLTPKGRLFLWIQDFTWMKKGAASRLIVQNGLPLWKHGFTRKSMAYALGENGFTILAVRQKILPNDVVNAAMEGLLTPRKTFFRGAHPSKAWRSLIPLLGLPGAFLLAGLNRSFRILVIAQKV